MCFAAPFCTAPFNPPTPPEAPIQVQVERNGKFNDKLFGTGGGLVLSHVVY